ncbi:MAG TPA: hypothetical protein VJP02_16495 [Candidatus Sulfotelmatobacter sp.]|nr:hypothetical protein [Candidatus Sulfotelmatobacter sp.]
MEYDITKCVFMRPDPSLITIDLAKHEQTAKEMRAARDAANPPRSEGPAEELRKLRRDFFNLESRAKNTEIYCNNKAGEVKLLEQRLTDAIKEKRKAVEAGNDLAARNHEHAITRHEDEKAVAEKEFNRAQRVAAQAANELKHWPHGERVAELEKSLA